MHIYVKVKTGAKHSKVVQLDDTHFEVSVNPPPVDGKANEAVIRLLAKHLGVAKSNLRIIRGLTSKIKTLEL